MGMVYQFLHSEHTLAFLIAILIFLITLFLVIKRWIGFSIALLLLLFSLAAGFLVDQQKTVQNYFKPISPSPLIENNLDTDFKDDFQKQISQAIQNLKVEVSSEKENLRVVMSQMKEVFESIDAQQLKLQNFIEETRDHFKANSIGSSLFPSEIHPQAEVIDKKFSEK